MEEAPDFFVFAMIVLLIFTTKASAHNSRTISLTPHIFSHTLVSKQRTIKPSPRPSLGQGRVMAVASRHPSFKSTFCPTFKATFGSTANQLSNFHCSLAPNKQLRTRLMTGNCECDPTKISISITHTSITGSRKDSIDGAQAGPQISSILAAKRAHFLEIYTHKLST